MARALGPRNVRDGDEGAAIFEFNLESGSL
jgi:hypothetical protein